MSLDSPPLARRGRVRLDMAYAVLTCILTLLTACSAKQYRKSADKESYAAIAQKVPLVTNMEPRFTIEQTNALDLSHLPVAEQTNAFLGVAATNEAGSYVLSLENALGLAVKQSRLYQTAKEQLYLTALSLTLSRHMFAPLFSASGSVQAEQVSLSDNLAEQPSVRAGGRLGVDWLIRDLGRISAAFTTDFLRFLAGDPRTLVSSELGATFSRPLLRNAGFKAEVENLTQSERDLLYGLRDFVRFRKSFTVQVASSYYQVLGARDAARNSFLNFESSRRAGERTRSLAIEGRTTQTDLGRFEQQELSAEGNWIAAVRSYRSSLDDFKILLGIPVDTRIILDEQDLRDLKIQQPDIQIEDAIRIALAARLDYQNTADQVSDSERKTSLARDRLKAQLDLVGSASMASEQADHGFPLPDPKRYRWNAGVNLDLPLERKAERNAYRAALISESRSKRDLELRRDQIALQVRESFRTLEQARRSYEISEIGVKLAQRRVEEQELLAEFGRAKALDQIDAQNALLASTDQRTQALVAHTIARLQFWENMGILYIKDQGQWVEGTASAGAGTKNQLN
jgi:outer membrane protein TolC